MLISVLISVMKNHSCSLISLVAGPKEERLQMVRPRLDQWHCAKPGAILEVPGFADVFQSVFAALRRSCVSVASDDHTSFRQLEITSQCPFSRSPMAYWSRWSPN